MAETQISSVSWVMEDVCAAPDRDTRRDILCLLFVCVWKEGINLGGLAVTCKRGYQHDH